MASVTLSPRRSRGDDFAALSREVRHAGLLDRRRVNYLVRIILNLAVFAAGWAAFVVIGDSWWQLFTAAFFAVMFTQLAFIGHDAGHKQIFRGRRGNDAVGYLHGGLVGISYDWWVGKHTRHHANPNHEDDDPDLHIPVLAFTRDQGRSKRGFPRWMAKHQAGLFFPLLLLEGLNLHWSSIKHVWRGDGRAHRLEAGLLIAHLVAYLTVVFTVLSPLTGSAFIVVHQCLWGVYMGCCFAPNHKGMPTLPPGHRLDYLRKQVLTSRNVSGGRWVDFVLGGLNYQIEHHLFPTMPRPNLRRAQTIVQGFCDRHGIDYAQCGLLRSYGYVLRHLRTVSAPLRHDTEARTT
ncbi:fatty acid desaturase family protein [Actinophytocola gossypii]|uniref:Acyl-CoA desaturase n=1 Tax=Actinophytocola gossypii TaxID=2812003 RepID=A0ABT2J2E8_9PSEU|nr:acyl-CoA desaturase [Actinophytocola gossypii]MCT2582029.1 acyl-CoA desaturase [Actinophytocola gossypii]